MGSAISSILTCNFSSDGKKDETREDFDKRITATERSQMNLTNIMSANFKRIEDKIDMKLDMANIKIDNLTNLMVLGRAVKH